MSKERELLQRVLEFVEIDEESDFGLWYDIKYILSHPEIEPSTDDYMYNKLKEDYDFLLNQIPPKREPLSDDEIALGAKMHKTDIFGTLILKSFVEGIKYAEKEHGIGVK